MISCPHPPSPPFPLRGRGSLKVYFAGGFAPGTPALNRLRHLQTLPCRCPAVVCPAGRRVDEHWRYPAGGLPGRSAARPALSFICCPHPPFPPSPPGKGESQSLFRRGLRPPHPCTEPSTALADAAVQEPGGGLPGRSPGRPALSFIGCPHPPFPPSPLPPPGKGESQSLFRRGLRPRHPCTESPTALTDAAVQVPGGYTPAAPLAGNLFLSVLRRTIGSAPGDARGEAPCIR